MAKLEIHEWTGSTLAVGAFDRSSDLCFAILG